MPAANLALIISLLLGTTSLSFGAGGTVPVIRNVGVIPAQWKGDSRSTSPFAKFRAQGISSLSTIVRESKRFQILNDQIIENNWDTAEGRQGLVDQFELDAYVSLHFDELNDMIVATARLLSPRLETYLIESERILKSDIMGYTAQDNDRVMRNLIFRLLNRYPIDVFVTSVQGPFITISGGQNQNLFEGDELSFHTLDIAQVHPANGAWISYNRKYLGKAKVIDSKSFSAIAKLTSLAYEGAISVGSSAKINHINSRKIFTRTEKPQAKEKLGQRQRIADLSPPPSRPSQPISKPEDRAPAPVPPIISNPQYVAKTEAPEEEEIREEVLEESMAEEPMPSDSGSGFLDNMMNYLRQNFNTVHGVGGLSLWEAGGSSTAKAKIPFWGLNQFELWGESPYSKDTNLQLRGKLGLGPTTDGSFFNLGISGAMTRRSPKPGLLFTFIDGIEYGGIAEITTVQASGSSFGGYDALTVGMIVKAYGLHHFVDLSKTIEGNLSLRLNFWSMGNAGLNGSKSTISSSPGAHFGYHLEFTGIARGKPQDFEWGGILRYKNDKYTMSTGNFNIKETFLGALVRLRF